MLKDFNCSPKLDQIVDLPTRNQVYEICTPLKDKIIDRVLPTDTFIDIVGYFVARRFRVDVLHSKALEVEPAEIDVNAYYDQDLDEGQKISIEIVLVTNPGDDHIIINDDIWSLFIHRLADSLAHELIHMRQSRSRNFIPIDQNSLYSSDINEEIQYLGSPDEIDAYAYNIAAELREQPNPIQKLSNPKSITIKDSLNLWVYINTFSKNFNNPVLKKLLKKIYRHLT